MTFSLLENFKANFDAFYDQVFCSPDSSLILIKSGTLCVQSKDIEQHVSCHEAISLEGNTEYILTASTPLTYYLFRYKSDYPLFWDTKISFEDTKRMQSTMELLDILDITHSKNEFAYRKSIFSDIITQYSIERFKKTAASDMQDTVVSSVISYLQNHIRSEWSIDEIAFKYNLSPAQLSNRFRSVTNMTPSKYMTYLKIQRAKDLLTDSTLRIKEIASECGFANEYYFSNFFKKHTGFSPANYRKEGLDSN